MVSPKIYGCGVAVVLCCDCSDACSGIDASPALEGYCHLGCCGHRSGGRVRISALTGREDSPRLGLRASAGLVFRVAVVARRVAILGGSELKPL